MLPRACVCVCVRGCGCGCGCGYGCVDADVGSSESEHCAAARIHRGLFGPPWAPWSSGEGSPPLCSLGTARRAASFLCTVTYVPALLFA